VTVLPGLSELLTMPKHTIISITSRKLDHVERVLQVFLREYALISLETYVRFSRH